MKGTYYDEANTDRLKDEYIMLLYRQMRDNGYAPRVDINPDFTLEYNEKQNEWHFKLSVYGVFVGKKKAREISSIYGYRPTYMEADENVGA